VCIAARVGDSVKTVLEVYAHLYADARRRANESDELGTLYDRGNVVETHGNTRTASDRNATRAELRVLAAKRTAPQ
jgi:hypothetical protein